MCNHGAVQSNTQERATSRAEGGGLLVGPIHKDNYLLQTDRHDDVDKIVTTAN